MTGKDLITLGKFIQDNRLSDKQVICCEFDEDLPKKGWINFLEDEYTQLVCSISWNGESFSIYRYFSTDDGFGEVPCKAFGDCIVGSNLIHYLITSRLTELTVSPDSLITHLCFISKYAITETKSIVPRDVTFVFPIVGKTGEQLIELIKEYQLTSYYILPVDLDNPNEGDYIEFETSDNEMYTKLLWLHDDYYQDVRFCSAGDVTYRPKD